MNKPDNLQKLLSSYLLNELSTDERTYVETIINDDPEVAREFDQLNKLVRLLAIQKNLDTINPEEERAHFERYIRR